MKKSKLLNLSVADNTNARVVPSMIIGGPAGYVSGDVLDANATATIVKEIDDKVKALQELLNTNGDVTDLIDSYNEIKDLVEGLQNDTTLQQMISTLESAISTLEQTIENNELVIAAALNDLNTRIAALESAA